VGISSNHLQTFLKFCRIASWRHGRTIRGMYPVEQKTGEIKQERFFGLLYAGEPALCYEFPEK